MQKNVKEIFKKIFNEIVDFQRYNVLLLKNRKVMKGKMLLLFLFLFGAFYCMSQPVTLKGKDFYVGNTKFYPVVMNFSVTGVDDNGNYFLSADNGYGATNSYECSNMSDCSDQLLAHFNYLVGIGFNTVRIVGIAPHYSSQIGFAFRFKPKTNPGANPLVEMNPTDSSDPIMVTILPFYSKILEIADSASLKVILLLKEDKTAMDDTEIELRRVFLEIIASYINNSNYRDALLAYDLINEPDYHDSVYKTKQKACEIISTWYDAIKANDPRHLITIGNCGLDDIWSYDPSILKVDFNSLHYYPEYSVKPYEDLNLSSIQQKMRDRTINDLYWFNQASIVPWIIGETGFTARKDAGINDGLSGTLNDMGDFVSHSLNNTCNCGAGGYSWWQYQDLDWGIWGKPSSGLLEHKDMPPSAEKQPAVNIFKNYTPQITAPCPVDYSPAFDESKLYYNRYGYTASSNKKITSYVKDQNGNPIKDAVVRVCTHFGNEIIQGIPVWRYDEYYTHTDVDGKFTAIPCPTRYGFIDSSQMPTSQTEIYGIRVSAAGAEVLEYNWWQTTLNPIVLNKIKDDVEVSGETVSNGQYKTYTGRKSLTVSNTTVHSGGNAAFTSQQSITLLPGFSIAAGGEASIYIAPPDCNELSSFQMPQKSMLYSPKDTKKSSGTENIELSFEKDFSESSVSVFPNPTNNTATIQLHSNDKDASLSFIKLYDMFGKLILSQPANEKSYIIDVSIYSKGVYFVEIKDKTKTYYQKLVIQ
jgi:hypothetical protein